MNFDFIIYTCAKDIDKSCARNVMRLPCYEAFARAMQYKGKVLIVPHYLSIIPEIFSKPQEIIVRTLTPTIHQLADNLYICYPIVPIKLGAITDLPLLISMCQWCLKQQVKTALRKIGAKEPWRVVSVEDPFHFVLLGLVNELLATYDCLDEYSLYGEVKEENPLCLAHERTLAQSVDVVFTTAKILYKKLKNYNVDTFYSPNAVDFELFHKATLSTTLVARDLERIPKPIVGFIGSLNFWFDFNLLQKVIAMRPDWSFVFVGEVEDQYPSVRKGVAAFKHLANVHFLGWIQMDNLPSYLKGFDAAILPYKRNQATYSISPHKMFQLMAAGVPLVSTSIPEIAQYQKVISIADNPLNFVHILKERLASVKEDIRVKRGIAIARENSWEKRVEERLEIIENYLRAKANEKVR